MNKDVGIRVVEKRSIDKDVILKVMINDAGDRIFVEFATPSRKLVVQKTYQNTYEESRVAEAFINSIKSLGDLKKYFGVK